MENNTVNMWFKIYTNHAFLTVNISDIYVDNGNIKLGVRVNKTAFLKCYTSVNYKIGELEIMDSYNHNLQITINKTIIDKYYKHSGSYVTYDNRDIITDNMLIGYVDITDLTYHDTKMDILNICSYPTGTSNKILCIAKATPKDEPTISKQWIDDGQRDKLMKQIEDLQNQLNTLP